MTPVPFPEANVTYGPPLDLEESQCARIPAFNGEIQGGSCDGLPQAVVCYRLTPEDLQRLNNNPHLYLAVIGTLPPHFLALSFQECRNVA